jgi:hypothetical protein
MFIHPCIASQLAREHGRDVLAEVSQRQLRRQRGHQERERRQQDHPPRRHGDCRCGHRGLNKQSPSTAWPLATVEPAAGQPAGITQQRQCPEWETDSPRRRRT